MRKSLKRVLSIKTDLDSLLCDCCGDACPVEVKDTGRHVALTNLDQEWGVVGVRMGDGLRDLCPECLRYLLAQLKRRMTERLPYFQQQLEGGEAS